MNDQIRENAEHQDDGHVTFQLAGRKKTITVDRSVLEYISNRKVEMERELEDKQHLEKAITIISEFDTKPFDFQLHAMYDRIVGFKEAPEGYKLVRMKNEKIREYGLFCMMLKILKGNFIIEQNAIRIFKHMVAWLDKLLWGDFSKTFDERNELSEFLHVLPYESVVLFYNREFPNWRSGDSSEIMKTI